MEPCKQYVVDLGFESRHSDSRVRVTTYFKLHIGAVLRGKKVLLLLLISLGLHPHTEMSWFGTVLNPKLLDTAMLPLRRKSRHWNPQATVFSITAGFLKSHLANSQENNSGNWLTGYLENRNRERRDLVPELKQLNWALRHLGWSCYQQEDKAPAMFCFHVKEKRMKSLET